MTKTNTLVAADPLDASTVPDLPGLGADLRVALDIGSTVVKLAWIATDGSLAAQRFYPRDYAAGIARQVASVLADLHIDPVQTPLLTCSSANGGLRVGIVTLTPLFSGTAVRNQVLLAGANPVYVHALDQDDGDTRQVDLLIVAGGIDQPDGLPMASRLDQFDPGRYRYGALVYAGNTSLAERFHARHPQVTVVANPLGTTLSTRIGSVFETVRRAYLDDLVHKEGISELPPALTQRIRPTPEVASRGFLKCVRGQGSFTIVGTCLVLDVGGATTDLHYTVELVADDSPVRPASGVSVARYVFTDLGVFASRDTLLQQLRTHPRLHDFLVACNVSEVREQYVALRDGEVEPGAALLAHACLFLALDRFSTGKGPGLPTAKLETLAQLILTGGAAQAMDVATVSRIVALLQAPGTPPPLVQIDHRYEIWVAGITWQEATAD